MSDAADSLLPLAASFVGCGFADDAERFMALIATGETEATARSMASHDSTCGLVARGLLGPAGLQIDDHRLRAPYISGRVNADLMAMAKEAGGWSTDVAALTPGSIVIIEQKEHVFILESLDGTIAQTIQGGEVDPVHFAQQVQRMQRRLVGHTFDGRPILGIIDVDKLVEHFGVEL